MQVEKAGQIYEFAFDLEKAIELEKQGFNVFKELKNLSSDGGVSFLAVDRVCSAVLGRSLVELANAGFRFGDLLGDDGIIMRVIFESDFFSDMRPGPSSQESAAGDLSASA